MISEYRVGNEVILKADGDSATRTVTEIVDPNCQLKVGDSVSDFSGNIDYLDDVYGGRFVIVSSRQIKSELKKLTYIEPNNFQGLTDFIQACTKDGVTNIQTKVMDDGYIMVLGEEPIRSSRRNNMIQSSYMIIGVSNEQSKCYWNENKKSFVEDSKDASVYDNKDSAKYELENHIPSRFDTKFDYFDIVKSSRQIKSSPDFKKFTADDIFDKFDVSQLTDTVFMDREECKNAKCGMEEFTDLMWEVAPTWLGVQNPDDVREVCRRAKNPQAKAFLEAFETAMENAKFTDKFYDSVKVHKKGNVHSSRRNNMIKSVYTREDYDRFDEVGNFIPYQPTSEELAKKDEIKKVLEQKLSDAYEDDPMDHYAGYDTTQYRVDAAIEDVAKQFGVDTDFVSDIEREIDYEGNARQMSEADWIYKHCTNKGRFWDWYNGEDVSLEELGIDEEQMKREVDEIVRDAVEKTFGQVKSSKAIKSSIEPWDVSQVTGTSDEDLGLSAVVEEYGNEFVNVDTATLEQIKDKLVQYFDDEAYVRDWNINNSNDQIEDAFDVVDPEEMDVDDLARYFDYDAYGRDIRLNDRMVWDTEDEHWVSLSEVEDENNDRYITW